MQSDPRESTADKRVSCSNLNELLRSCHPELRHRGLSAVLIVCQDFSEHHEGQEIHVVFLSYLTLAHGFERMINN